MVNLGGPMTKGGGHILIFTFWQLTFFHVTFEIRKKLVKSYNLLIGNNHRPVWQRPQAAPCIYSPPDSKEQNLKILSYI